MKQLLFTLTLIFLTSFLKAQRFKHIPEFGQLTEIEEAVGVSVADYDLDGDLDIYIVATEVFDAQNPLTWSRLLRNDGTGTFEDVTLEANLINWDAENRNGNLGAKLGASWGDYDNDGYPDLFLANHGFDELWHNQGDGTFRNVTEEAKVAGCYFCYSSNGLWWDYDQDGDLDLYVSDWRKPNRFYQNEGNGKFTDISIASGLRDQRHTFSSLPIDLDQDGLLDIYIVNDNVENQFFWNRGAEQFEEATDEIGLGDTGNGMGIDLCDYNQDGQFDIYVTNIYEYQPNPFFVSTRSGNYVNESKALQIDDTGWGWGIRFFDADHDTDEDMYVVNGFFFSIAEDDRNQFYLNEDGAFTEIGVELGLNSNIIGMGLEVFDADMDGDLEILVGNRGAWVDFFKNETVEASKDKNWVQIQLEGTISDRNAVGSTVKISCAGNEFYRYHSGVNIFGQSIKPVHFGLGAYDFIDEIKVTWPNGTKEYFSGSTVNKRIELVQGTGRSKSLLVEEEELEPLEIYPNPFKEEITIQLSDYSEEFVGWVRFQLVDILGRQVLFKEQWIQGDSRLSLQLPVPSLEAGLYFYKLSTKEGEQAGSILKK